VLRVGNSIYRRALTNVPTWNEVWQLFLSEPSTYESALDDAERAADWIHEHQNMTPEESVENQFEVQYEEMLDWFPGELQGKDCHRAIGVRERECDREVAQGLDPLGIYWSEYSEFAETYWKPEHEGCVLIFRARIDVQHINVLETLTVRLHNPDEHEVRFNEGAKLYVYECTIEREGRWSGSGEPEVVKIEDYRTC
jgi:hypothetical protein